jgi:hypothetical protein
MWAWRAAAVGRPVASTITSKGRSATMASSPAAMKSSSSQAALASAAEAQTRIRCGSIPAARNAEAARSASTSTAMRARISGTRWPCDRKLWPKPPAPTRHVSTRRSALA